MIKCSWCTYLRVFFFPCCLDPSPVFDKHWSCRVNQESDHFLNGLCEDSMKSSPVAIQWIQRSCCMPNWLFVLTLISYFTIKGLLKHWENANETDVRPVHLSKQLNRMPFARKCARMRILVTWSNEFFLALLPNFLAAFLSLGLKRKTAWVKCKTTIEEPRLFAASPVTVLTVYCTGKAVCSMLGSKWARARQPAISSSISIKTRRNGTKRAPNDSKFKKKTF